MSATITPFLARARRVIRVVRLSPFDVSTAEGRSLERYRRAALSGMSNMCARVAMLTTALTTVPMTVTYLGVERYGMWLTISSLLAFAYVADLGVTQGLQTAIARTTGNDDKAAAIRYVSSATAILVVNAFVGATLLLAAYWLVPWAGLFNVSAPEARREAGPAAIAFGATWLVNIVLGAVTRVNEGFQDGYINNLWQTLGSVLSLAGVFLGIRAHAGLPELMLLFAGGPVLANVANGVILFGWRMPWLRPHKRHVQMAVVRELVGSGVWYLTMGLCFVAVQSGVSLVIAHFAGSTSVPSFGVPARVASVSTLFLTLVAAPLWSAYAEAIARGDAAWVKRTMRRASMLQLLLGLAFAAGFVSLGRRVIEWWVHGAVHPSKTMLAGLAAYSLVLGLETNISFFLLASNVVRFQALLWLASVAIGIPLLVLAVMRFGVDGAPWALFIITLGCRVAPAYFVSQRALRALRPAGEAQGAKGSSK